MLSTKTEYFRNKNRIGNSLSNTISSNRSNFSYSCWRFIRLCFGRWRRFARWEYWPTAPIYLPVFATALWNAIRYRSLKIITCVNPGMPSSGFVLDSKSDILASFGESEHVATFQLIAADLRNEEKFEQLHSFLQSHQLQFPIVLKPDFGERGKEVCIAKNHEEAKNYLHNCEEDIIIQEFVAGVEYGVFYERKPGEVKGRITGITEKAGTYVVGDGESTLEELILSDSRAVCQAPIFLALQKDKLGTIPPQGEKVKLNVLGTHSQGSLFLDANATWTQEMETAIDKLSQQFDGFHLGRYDIRTRSLEDFQQGKNFKAVELNGVTSEPTHMYDPKHSIFYAWKTLTKQWNRAFLYGYLNHQQGHSGIGLSDLVARIQKHSSKK